MTEWLRYDGQKVESVDILESLQPSFLRSFFNLIGLVIGKYKIFPDQPLPADMHWNIDYDFSN